MPTTDRFGLPLTAASAAAAADYVAGVDLLLAADPGAEARLDRALAADPDFALAHIALARLWQSQARIAEARAAAERAQLLARRFTARERRHVAAVALAVAGDPVAALALVREHAAECPRDALPLSLALGVYGLLGFSGRRDHHEAQLALLEELAPRWPEDWWFLGYLGWARIETGDVASGTGLVERSLALNPRNAHGAHQRAHGYFEAGDAAGAAGFLAEWLPAYPRAGGLHCHLSWHLALALLALGEDALAMAVYRDAIRPAVALSAPLLSLADGASFLWRWQIYRKEPPLAAEWTEVAAHARQHFPRASLAFADLHAAMAEAATGDEAAVGRRIAGLRQLAGEGRLPPGAGAVELCEGVAAFARKNPAAAARSLAAALADLPRIGGSHAQREVFEDTLAAACIDAGALDAASVLLRARLARRPSARDREWLRQCAKV